MLEILLVGIGGFLGANARYFMATKFSQLAKTFPYPTLFINLTGSFLLTFFLALSTRLVLPPESRLLFTVGFCGGYTTFSTFTYETLRLIQDHKPIKGVIIYMLGSYLLGLVSAWLGLTLAWSML